MLPRYDRNKVMEELDIQDACDKLNKIMKAELAGVVRYTHYALMVTGPYRLPIVDFMQAQAAESLAHAQQAGEILTGLEGHPSLSIDALEESGKHTMRDVLTESLEHERHALTLYADLLAIVTDRSVYLEEYARTMIGQEELHVMEIKKMLRDFTG